MVQLGSSLKVGILHAPLHDPLPVNARLPASRATEGLEGALGPTVSDHMTRAIDPDLGEHVAIVREGVEEGHPGSATRLPAIDDRSRGIDEAVVRQHQLGESLDVRAWIAELNLRTTPTSE
jgi:hypothetical protein